jgi:thymidylate synthase
LPYEGGPIVVHGMTIPDAWIKMIYHIYRYGRKNLMNANTDRWVKEVNNMVVVVHDPQNEDLSINPFLVPLTIEKIRAYQAEIKSAVLPEGKAYTYGNKLRAYSYPSAEEIKNLVKSYEYKDFEFGKGPHLDFNVSYSEKSADIDQVKDLIDVLKRDPYSKACVAITWHVQDELMRKHKSSPCLVLVQAMVQDEKLNLTVFFRSHDMTQGWPENAYGCAALQKEIADGVGFDAGILTVISGSAQIYNHYYNQVEDMLAKHWNSEIPYNDPRGNFSIFTLNGEIKVRLLHPENNAELEKFSGKTAKELMDKIAMTAAIIDTRHAIYLGTELQKAEFALQKGLAYEQDHNL